MGDKKQPSLLWWQSPDMYGRSDGSKAYSPDLPMYDAAGIGDGDGRGMSERPVSDFFGNASTAANLGFWALQAPGVWKALTIPTMGPLAALFAESAYRNAQQLNGDHPAQVNQRRWEDRINKQMSDPTNPLVDLFTGPPVR